MRQERRLIDKRGLERKGIVLSNTHIDRMERAGKFPRHINLFGPGGRKQWDEDEIDALIAAKLAAREVA